VTKKECISEAAILKNGRIYKGKRHHNIIARIVNKTGIKPAGGKQGFVTDNGRFVSREEAAKIAFASGQIKEQKERLFSEDLY